jgi:hypothetical protein
MYDLINLRGSAGRRRGEGEGRRKLKIYGYILPLKCITVSQE